MSPDDAELRPSRTADVGGQTVRRALPQRHRRTVGAWCFADHFGPTSVRADAGIDVGPHPHMGLQTVTWVVSGEILHRDSLGSEQLIRPGQLNLMTAGNGVSHSEEHPSGFAGELHGIQLWVAQPESTRHGSPSFEHLSDLPRVELAAAEATVLVGEFGGVVSAARRDSDLVGIDLHLRTGTCTLPVDPRFEHALVVLEGEVVVLTADSMRVTPGNLAYLGSGADEVSLAVAGEARAVLLGGVPFEAPILMAWNFVARERSEIDRAVSEWNAGSERFGHTASPLGRIPAPQPPWSRR